MDRTAKENRSPAGWGGQFGELFRDLRAIPFTLLPGLCGVALALADYARLAVELVPLLFVLAGCAQLARSRHRRRKRRYRSIARRLTIEEGLARLWFLGAAALVFGGLLLPPLSAAILGFATSLCLVVRGFFVGTSSADAEDPAMWKASAAEECAKIEAAAERAEKGPLIPFAQLFAHVAKYRVKPGEMAVLQSLILLVTVAAAGSYLCVAVALGAVELSTDREIEQPPLVTEPPPPAPGETETEPNEEPGGERTYADECPEIPDPLSIEHGLGQLFKRDGAFKAGCGTPPVRVPGTSTWAAAGVCGGATRSVGVSVTDHKPVLLYGEAATFAWAEAMEGNLVMAEAATPDGGDVDLIETLGGTHVFARRAPGGGDAAQPQSCLDVTETSRPFTHLPPQMAYSWSLLLEWRAAWSWPEEQGTAAELFAFASYPSEEITAYGGCHLEVECHLEVDGDSWDGEGTSFVKLAELRPYMP